jgi:hypothetical protein
VTSISRADNLPGFVRSMNDRVARVERRGSEVPNGLEAGQLMVVLDLNQLPEDAAVGTRAFVDDIDQTWQMGADGTWSQV